MNRYDLLVFDWDGTLFDSTQIIVRAIQDAVRDVGGTVPSNQDAAYVIGLQLGQALARAAPDVPAALHAQLQARYRYHYMQRQHDIALFDGVLPLLAELKANHYRLAVATGKSRVGLDEALASVELHALFDASRTADETTSKPHPRMLLELMDELQVAPERTLMIGDTSHDLQLALNAGCDSVAVSYGAHAQESFAGLNPQFVAHTVAQLRQWLLG